MTTATTTTDGGSTDDDFRAALEDARGRVLLEDDAGVLESYASPERDLPGPAGAAAWAMAPVWLVVSEAVRSTRLDDEDGAAPSEPRTDRAFLFGRGGEDGAPAIVVRGAFVNRYDDERVVVETPAPWDVPDEMASANELVKDLEWDDHHWSFEEEIRRRGIDAEDVWVIDRSGVEPLREAAAEAGYEWTDGGAEPTADEETLADLAGFLVEAEVDRDEWELVGGDEVVVRYESKQTGDVKEKTGTVTNAYAGLDGVAFSFERDDGKTNSVKADGGEVGIYSTSRYPFMGAVRSVEVRTE